MNWIVHPAVMPPQEGGSGMQPIMMMILMVAIMYFLMIRPSQRREKERRGMIDKLSKGDRILFGGGFIGVVTGIKDKSLLVKSGESNLEISRQAVASVLGPDTDIDSAAQQNAPR